MKYYILNYILNVKNFQKSGSFKIRGASNAVLQLSKKDLSRGVVTASSGNHGAALSLIVKKLGGVVKVVMPNNTPKVKVNNVQRMEGKLYGVNLIRILEMKPFSS